MIAKAKTQRAAGLVLHLVPTGQEQEIDGLPFELYQGLDEDGDSCSVFMCWELLPGHERWTYADRVSLTKED